jgi:hypothetical protein
MERGMPGTWLAETELEPGGEPAEMDGRCGCNQPLIWDGRCGIWRHLKDGTPCVPPGSEEAVR